MRELNSPLTEEDKAWLKSRNMHDYLEAAENAEAEDSSGDDEVEMPEDDVPYSDWNQKQLRKELRARELPVSGKVADLAARLEQDDASQ